MSVPSPLHTNDALYWEIMNAGAEVRLSNLRGVDMQQVTNALSHPDSAVQSMNLRFSTIGGDGATVLSEALKTNTTLTKMNLQDNQVGDEGASAFAEALKTNTALTELNLGSSEVGDEGAIALAEALKTNTTLTTLHLFKSEVGDEGAIALAEALTTNTALTKLGLWDTEVGDEGASAFAEALKTNTALTKLDLWNNEVGDKGAIALAEALKTNTTLTKLDLGSNEMSDEGAIAFAEALKTNTALTNFDFDRWNSGVLLDEGAVDVIHEMLERNRYRTRLDSIVAVFQTGSISNMVDVLAENNDSLSISFDLLRVRMGWAPETLTREGRSKKRILQDCPGYSREAPKSAGDVDDEIADSRSSDVEVAHESKRCKLGQE